MATADELEALSAQLRDAYGLAWDDIETEQRAIADDPVRFTRRARLREMQAAVNARLDQVDEQARAWLADGFPTAYRFGAETAAAALGERFRWTAIDTNAVTLLAQDTFAELLAASDGVEASTKALIRTLAREQALLKAAAGKTASQAGRDLRRLLEQKGIFAVRYRDGSKHGIGDYADMLLRTKTAVAHNAGGLTVARRAGIRYVEVFDGIDCFVGRFLPYGELVGLVRARYSGPMLTIECDGDASLAEDGGDLPRGASDSSPDLSARQPLLDVHADHPLPVDPASNVASAPRHRLTVGPNHPVLTRAGWRRAHQLREGDEVAYDQRLEDSPVLAETDLVEVPMAEDVFGSLAERFGTHVRSARADDLHGDGQSAHGEIEVVGPAGRLLVVGDSRFIESSGQAQFVRSDARPSVVARGRSSGGLGRRLGAAYGRLMSGLYLRLALLGGHRRPLPIDAAPTGAEAHHAVAPGSSSDLLTTGVALERDGLHWLTIHSLGVQQFDGYVFDATTSEGCFTVNGFVVKNCGWTSHTDPDHANGSIRTVDEAAAQTLAHPRCQRAFGARPDLTTEAQARSARPSTTAAQRADQAAAETQRALDQRSAAAARRRQDTLRASALAAAAARRTV